MKKAKILIVIQEGVITSVLSSSPDVQVVTVDYDCFEDGSRTPVENADDAVYVHDVEIFNGVFANTLTGNLGEKQKAVQAELMKLDEQSSTEFEGVAGFGSEDYVKTAAAAGYILTADLLRDVAEYSHKRWDACNSGDMWMQLVNIIQMYAQENGLEKHELFMLEDSTPAESGDYQTDLGLVYFDLKHGDWMQQGSKVNPIWYKYDDEENDVDRWVGNVDLPQD